MKNSGSWLLTMVLCLTGCGVTPEKYTFEADYPETKHVTFHFTTTHEKMAQRCFRAVYFTNLLSTYVNQVMWILRYTILRVN